MDRLTQDAGNRALRYALWSLVVGILLDVWPLVNDALGGSDPVDWGSLGKAALRIVLGSAVAFIARRWGDNSPIPTPLPPTPQPAPATPDPLP